jgi:hypothetical protein
MGDVISRVTTILSPIRGTGCGVRHFSLTQAGFQTLKQTKTSGLSCSNLDWVIGYGRPKTKIY